MLQLFPQTLGALQGKRETFSREFMQWLRGIVVQTNFLTDVAAVPPKGIVWANLSAADIAAYFTAGLGNAGNTYEGWAICDGGNGTPNIANRFVRANTAGSGATGGTDSSAHTHAVDHDHGAFTSATESGHTHAIDHDHGAFTSATESGHTHAIDHDHAAFTSATESGHTHAIDHDHASFTSGAGSAHTHSTPSHQHQTDMGWDSAGPAAYFRQDGSGNPLSGSIVESSVTGAQVTIGASGTRNVRLALTRNDGSGTSGSESAHTHPVDPPALTGTSGASSGHTHSIDVPAITATSGASSGHTHSIDVPALVQASGASSGHTHSIDVPAFTGTSGAASATDNRPAYIELVPLMRVWT